MGLAISKALIEAYGGTIEPHSSLGEGTRMVVSLAGVTLTCARALAFLVMIQLYLRCALAFWWERRTRDPLTCSDDHGTVLRWRTACAQAPPSAPAAARQAQPASVVLTLADALARAKANSPQFQAAVTELGLAREDRYQARASLLAGRGLQQQLYLHAG